MLSVSSFSRNAVAQFSEMRTESGHAAVVRNGHHPERPFQTGIGPVSLRVPKVRSKDGTPVTFRSALVPPYMRKTKTLESALPWLYLKRFAKYLNHLTLPEIIDFNALNDAQCLKFFAKRCKGYFQR